MYGSFLYVHFAFQKNQNKIIEFVIVVKSVEIFQNILLFAK